MKTYTLSLPCVDVFQILDALDSRAQSWEYTARLLAGESSLEDDFCVAEDCRSYEEAVGIARHFRDVAEKIRAQMAAT